MSTLFKSTLILFSLCSCAPYLVCCGGLFAGSCHAGWCFLSRGAGGWGPAGRAGTGASASRSARLRWRPLCIVWAGHRVAQIVLPRPDGGGEVGETAFPAHGGARCRRCGFRGHVVTLGLQGRCIHGKRIRGSCQSLTEGGHSKA